MKSIKIIFIPRHREACYTVKEEDDI